jgi:hypothetical protein
MSLVQHALPWQIQKKRSSLRFTLWHSADYFLDLFLTLKTHKRLNRYFFTIKKKLINAAVQQTYLHLN